MQLHNFKRLVMGEFGILLLAVAALAGFGYWQVTRLQARVATLESTLASTSSLLLDTIQETQLSFSESLNREKESLQTQLGSVSAQLGDVSGTVGTLQKLSQTDPELLAKYSKVYFLNENYAPERVTNIDSEYLYSENHPETIQSQVWPFLEDMLKAAKHDNIELYVYSAYRPFSEQAALKSAYTVTYGAGTANAFSADQGYSEHQLGTTVDLITTGLGGQLDGFQNTDAYQWLTDNAYKYGFTLSYPPNNGYYVFEPWHWRFVGIKLATYLHRHNEYFYDLDQRTIDEYLADIFDN